MNRYDDGSDEDVIQLDRYVDDLLAGSAHQAAGLQPYQPHEAAGLQAGVAPEPVDDDVRAAADVLHVALTRFHPSFRFEERLARRLRDAARDPVGTTRTMGVVIPLGPLRDLAATGTRAGRMRSRRVGGAILGGAIASGVSIASLAGAAALVAWRRGRSDTGWERML
ncbi:MAG: hypothetical protein KF809_13365 [Chloroflexi bacterium]|nr:hypothetical protein [Chloroflexota bacterium]